MRGDEEREDSDREAKCPFLLRCFWKPSRHNNLSEYSKVVDEVLPGNEVQLYMWPDSTLREVAEALRLVVVPALASTSFSTQNCKLDMSVVFLTQRDGKPVMRDLACVALERPKTKSGDNSSSSSVLEKLGDANKTLEQLRVRPGDMMDVAVLGEGQSRREIRDTEMSSMSRNMLRRSSVLDASTTVVSGNGNKRGRYGIGRTGMSERGERYGTANMSHWLHDKSTTGDPERDEKNTSKRQKSEL